MNNFEFHNPIKIIFGKGQLERAGEETAALGKKALLVTGRGSAERSGLLGKVKTILESFGVKVAEFHGISPNPEIESVQEGAKIFRKKNADVIIALGGGSVIDASKAMAAAAFYEGDPWDFFDKKAKPQRVAPIGVILTLAASGSEMNGNSVVSNAATEEKRPMYHPLFHPKFSILDPTLTFTLPPEQTAYGAVDILSHVFEQYFHNVPSTPIQDGLAETVMRTVINSAPAAMRTPDDYDARANIMWSSSLALNGLIAAGGGGDWASHMLEHELSAKYGIAHGAGLAIVFPSWMRQVYKANTGRFTLFAKNVWDIPPAGKSDEELALAGIDATKAFFRETLGLGVTMADYGIDGARIEEMAASAMKHKELGTFKKLSKEDLAAIYKGALS